MLTLNKAFVEDVAAFHCCGFNGLSTSLVSLDRGTAIV